MKRERWHRLRLWGQWGLVAGLLLAAGWNLVALFRPGPAWWPGLLLPLPGLLLWLAMLAAPLWQIQTTAACTETYRLVYNAPPGWDDAPARTALLNLVQSGVVLEIIWAGDGEGIGCWLAVSGYGPVLERLAGDVFPEGRLEPDDPPRPGPGAAVLAWTKPPPPPVTLCGLAGIDGVYYRRRGPQTAIVALWGPKVGEALQDWARPDDLLPASGPPLFKPPFRAANPWPELPPFPASEGNPGLAAVSKLVRVGPVLRATGRSLLLGRDGTGQPVGFNLPELAALRTAWLVGQAAAPLAVELTCRAVERFRLPVVFIDGRGDPSAGLARRLLREIAAGRVALCDVERPGQARHRLNPLWLPPDDRLWPDILTGPWLAWLRELGVTPGGLGRDAYRYTVAAVLLTGLASARQGLELDAPGLRDNLLAPDYLRLLDETHCPSGLPDEETRAWWLNEGRHTPAFDAHLRLGHLRERLSGLLKLPEYGLLWRGPYLDPQAALQNGLLGLVWRAPDRRGRLRPYLSSQLAALSALLAARPADRPVLVILFEAAAGQWPVRLAAYPAARLLIAGERPPRPDSLPPPDTLLVSRLDRDAAAELAARFPPQVRPSDLRRLPPGRLVVRQGEAWGTVDWAGGQGSRGAGE